MKNRALKEQGLLHTKYDPLKKNNSQGQDTLKDPMEGQFSDMSATENTTANDLNVASEQIAAAAEAETAD